MTLGVNNQASSQYIINGADRRKEYNKEMISDLTQVTAIGTLSGALTAGVDYFKRSKPAKEALIHGAKDIIPIAFIALMVKYFFGGIALDFKIAKAIKSDREDFETFKRSTGTKNLV